MGIDLTIGIQASYQWLSCFVGGKVPRRNPCHGVTSWIFYSLSAYENTHDTQISNPPAGNQT